MTSKHVVNEKEEWASESIRGYLHANSEQLVALEEFPNVVVRRDQSALAAAGQVALLAGGGSGHEPAHCGFIGPGMLTGVVCGHLFASPSTAAILAAVRFVGAANPAGVLLIVKNYTGDRLNFGLAAKRAQLEGIKVDWLLVDDDVALLNQDGTAGDNDVVGSRGLCGTVLVEKLAGALADQGKSLAEIKEALQAAMANRKLRTLGISLSGRVTLPGEAPKSQSEEEAALIEVGLGIHGETGRKKMPLVKSHALAQMALGEYVLEAAQPEQPRRDICLMVNNLGGLSNLELYVFANDCVRVALEQRQDVRVRRLYVGAFMTSLNMNGFSVTALYLEPEKADFYLELLDASTEAPAWTRTCGRDIERPLEYAKADQQQQSAAARDLDAIECVRLDEALASRVRSAMELVCHSLVGQKDLLNKLDSDCGDGDCGDSLTTLSQTVLRSISQGLFGDFQQPHKVFDQLSELLENGGGSLCILLALFFSAAAKAFATSARPSDQLDWLEISLNSLELGIDAVQEYGRAKPGNRSIVDPLCALRSSLHNYVECARQSQTPPMTTEALLQMMATKTRQSAQATAQMVPRVGRASYVDASTISSPDAGAMAVSFAIDALHKAYAAQ